MGQSFDARCGSCGSVFTARIGGGFTFDLLHCERCGKELVRERHQAMSDGIDDALERDRCGCGGSFSAEAPPRCPTCRSERFEVVGNHICYD